MVETFLWTTLSFDLALALENTHLRPKTVSDGGIGKLWKDLTGKPESEIPASLPSSTAQDGAKKPFRGKHPSFSFLAETLSGPEFDILQMALSPLKTVEETAVPSDAEIVRFFSFVKVVGYDDLVDIQNVRNRIERSPIDELRKTALRSSVSSLKEKITPLLEHIGTPFRVGLSDILSSGTEEIDDALRARLSEAFAKAEHVRGPLQSKLTAIKSHVISLPGPAKTRLLHLLALIGKIEDPTERQHAIASFAGRYGFSIENAIQLSRIFNGKAKLPIGLQDTLQMMFTFSIGMDAPTETIDILVRAMEDNKISLTSIGFEIAHWSDSLLGKKDKGPISKEKKKELIALLSERPQWFKQFAEEAINRGTVERIMLGKEPDIFNIPYAGTIRDLQMKDFITNVQAYWTANLIEHYGFTPSDLREEGLDEKVRDFGALTVAKGISSAKISLFGERGLEAQTEKMRLLENHFRTVANRRTVREKLTDPRASLLLFGALYPRATSNVHLALSALTFRYPDLFYKRGEQPRLIDSREAVVLVQEIVEAMKAKPLRRDEIEGLVDGIFQDSRFRRFSREYAPNAETLKTLKENVEGLVALLGEPSPEGRGMEEVVEAVFQSRWLQELALQSLKRFKVKRGMALSPRGAMDLTEKLFVDLRNRVVSDLQRKVFYDVYKEIRNSPIRDLDADAIAEVVLDAMHTRLEEAGIEQSKMTDLIQPISDRVSRYLSQRPLREDQITLLTRVLHFALEIESKRQGISTRDGGTKETLFENFVEIQKLPNGFERRVMDLTQTEGLKEKVAALENLFGVEMMAGDEYALLVRYDKRGIARPFALSLENKELDSSQFVKVPSSVEGRLSLTEERFNAFVWGYQQALEQVETQFAERSPGSVKEWVHQKLGIDRSTKPTTAFGWSRLLSDRLHLKTAFSLGIILTAFVIPGIASAIPAPVQEIPNPPAPQVSDIVEVSPSEPVDVAYFPVKPGLSGITDLSRFDPEETDFSKWPILSLGDKGDWVHEAQLMLNQALLFEEVGTLLKGTGVDVQNLKENWKIDDGYGWRTEAMVYAFQKKHGLKLDADIGPETWKKLVEVVRPVEPKQIPQEKDEGPLYASLTIEPLTDVTPPVTETVTPVQAVSEPTPVLTVEPTPPQVTKAPLPPVDTSLEVHTLTEQMKLLGEKAPISAIFWDPDQIQNPDTLFGLARANGVTDLFLDAGVLERGEISVEKMAELIQHARTQGIQEIRLIAGNPNWAYEPDSGFVFFDTLLSKVKELQAKGVTIQGVGLDVEPYLKKDKWNYDLTGYVAFRDTVQKKVSTENLDLIVFEPFWYGQEILERGEKLVGYKPYQGVTAIMSYRDNAMGDDGIYDISGWMAPLGKHLLGFETVSPREGVPEGITFFGEEKRLPGELSKLISHAQKERADQFQGTFLHFDNVSEAERIFRLLSQTPKMPEKEPAPYLLGEYDYEKNAFITYPRPIGTDPSFETDLKPFEKKGTTQVILEFIGDVAKDAWGDLKYLWSKVFKEDTSLEVVKEWKGNLYGENLPGSIDKGVVLWNPEEIPRDQIPQYLEAESLNGTNVILYGTAHLLYEGDRDLRDVYRQNAFLFIEEANNRGIRVYSLQGDHSWILSPSKGIGYFHALESIVLQGKKLNFAKHVFDVELGIPLHPPKDKKTREYREKVIANYPHAIDKIQRSVGDRFVNFIDPTYTSLSLYQKVDAPEIIMAYDTTPEAILALVRKTHVPGRPYTVAVDAGHAVGEFNDFHGREDQIRPVLEKVHEALQSDPDFKGFTVHFVRSEDRREVLEEGHLSSWDLVQEGIGKFIHGRAGELVKAKDYLVGEVRPTRYGFWEETPLSFFNWLKLRIQALIGGVFGLDVPLRLKVPIGGEPGTMYAVGRLAGGLPYESVAQIADISVTIVDKDKNPMGESYQYDSLMNAEEPLFVPGPGHYARFDVLVKKGEGWRSFSGNVIVTTQHRSEVIPEEAYSEGIDLQNEEQLVSVYVPINKWGMHLPKILLVTEVETETEKIVDEVGGPDLESVIKWIEKQNGSFPTFVKGEKEYDSLAAEFPTDTSLIEYLKALTEEDLEKMLTRKRGNLKPIERMTLAFLNIRELPPIKVGIDRFDPEVVPGPTYYELGEEIYLPLKFLSEGTRPGASHYVAHLIMRNTTGGVHLQTGEKKNLWINNTEYVGWIEGNKIILEPVSGKWTEDVILGGDWVRTDGTPQEKITFSQSGFEAQAFRTKAENGQLILQKTHDVKMVNGREILVENTELKGPVRVFDERLLRIPVTLKKGENLQGILNLGKLPAGYYYLNGYITSEDETFSKRFYMQFQVGTPKLELSPVRTDADLMAHSPATPFIQTEVENTGKTPLTVYPVTVFVDKRTGEVVTTEKPKDPYEAYFILPNGKTEEVLTIQPGQKVPVKVKLAIPPDPLTAEKDSLLTLRQKAKTLISLDNLETVKKEADTLRDQALHLAQKAFLSRTEDLKAHRENAKTDDLKIVVSDLEKGIQGLSNEIKTLQGLKESLNTASSIDELSSILYEAFGRLNVALNEASNGIYSVRLDLVDVNMDRSRGLYLGNRGALATTDPLLFEVYTEGSIERKVEDYVDLQGEIRKAEGGLIELETNLARQRLGIERQQAELEKARQGEWIAPTLQGVNGIALVSSESPEARETYSLLEKTLQEQLGEDIWKMRGGFERKSWPHILRPFRPVVKFVKGIFDHTPSYEEIEVAQIQKLSQPDTLKAFEEKAIEQAQLQFEQEGKAGHLAYLDFVSLQRDLVALDEKMNAIYSEYEETYGITSGKSEKEKIEALRLANQKAEEILKEEGGLSGIYERVVRILNHYLAGQGISYEIEGNDPQVVLAFLKAIGAEHPDDPLLKTVIPLLADQMERVGQKEKELSRTEAFAGELDTLEIPGAKAHLEGLSNDLSRAERAMAYALKVISPEERETRLTRLEETYGLTHGYLQNKVETLEAEIAALEKESQTLKEAIAKEPELTAETMAHQAFLDVRAFQTKTQLKIHAYVERGKQLMKAGQLSEAKAFFEKAVFYMDYHHSHAYLKDQYEKAERFIKEGKWGEAGALLEEILGEELSLTVENYRDIQDRAKVSLKAVQETEEKLSEAAKKWAEIDEKLKEDEKEKGTDLGRTTPLFAAQKTISQVDNFLYGSIYFLETVRAERLKKGGNEEKLFISLVENLSALRVKLHGMKEGENLSGILLEAESIFEKAERQLNKFSLKLTSLNFAFSFIKKAIFGNIGPLVGVTLSLPDPKATPREVVRELTYSIDLLRMVMASRSHLTEPSGETLETLASEKGEELLASQDSVIAKKVRLEEVHVERGQKEEALKVAQAQLTSIESDKDSLLKGIEAVKEKVASLPVRVLTAKEKVQEDVAVLAETIERSKEGHKALVRTEERAEKSKAVLEEDIERRTLNLQELEGAIQDTLNAIDPNMVSLYQIILGEFQTYEQKERAKDLTDQGLFSTSGPLFHPKRLLQLLKVWENPVGTVGLGLTVFLGDEVKYLPLVEHELISALGIQAHLSEGKFVPSAVGVHSVRIFDDAVGVGMSPLEFTRKLDKEKKDFYRFGLILTHKFGSEDKTVKAYEYLTEQEAAFILAMAIGPKRAKEVISSIEHRVSQEVALASGQSHLKKRKLEEDKLVQFLENLSTQIDRSKGRMNDLKETLTVLQGRLQLLAQVPKEGPLGTFKEAEELSLPEKEKETPIDQTRFEEKEVPGSIQWGSRILELIGIAALASWIAAIFRRGFSGRRKVIERQKAFEAKPGYREETASQDTSRDGGDKEISVEKLADSVYLGEYNTTYNQPFTGARQLRSADDQKTWHPVMKMQEKWKKPFVVVSKRLSEKSKMVQTEPVQAPETEISLIKATWRTAWNIGKVLGVVAGTILLAAHIGVEPFFLSVIGALLGPMFMKRLTTKSSKTSSKVVSGIFAGAISSLSLFFTGSYLFGLDPNQLRDTLSVLLNMFTRALPFFFVFGVSLKEWLKPRAEKEKARLEQKPLEISERAIKLARQFAEREMGKKLEDLPYEDATNLIHVYLFLLSVQEADVVRTTDGTSVLVGKNGLLEAVADLRAREHLKAILPGIHAYPMKPARSLVFSGWFWGIPVQWALQAIMYFSSMTARVTQAILHPRSNTKPTLNKYFAISKQELNLGGFTFLVEGRWLLGHLFVMHKEFVGGKPVIRLSLIPQKYIERYRISKALVESLMKESDLESKTAAHYRAFPSFRNPWVEAGEREFPSEAFKVAPFLRNSSDPSKDEISSLGEGFLDAEGVVAFNFAPYQGDFKKFSVMTPYSVEIQTGAGGKIVGVIPSKKGTKFVISKATMTTKGGHVEAGLDLARGDTWFEPVVKGGKVEIQPSGLEEMIYGKDIQEARETIQKESGKAAVSLKKTIEDRSGTYEVTLVDGHTKNVLIEKLTAAHLGFKPHEGTRKYLSKIKAQTLNRLLEMLPISFYELTQDTIVAAIMAHYDPLLVKTLVEKMMKLDQKRLSRIKGDTNIPWKEMKIEAALLEKGIVLPFDLVNSTSYQDTLDGLADYLVDLHKTKMAQQRGEKEETLSEIDQLRNHGMAIVKAKEYLGILAQMEKDPNKQSALERMSLLLGHRAAPTFSFDNKIYSESIVYQMALLRNLEGHHKALESDIAGGLYAGSHDSGVFRGGLVEVPFSVSNREPWQTRAEKISDIYRTRSWAFTSQTGARTGGVRQGAESYSSSTAPLLEEIVRAARAKGHLVEKVILDGKTLRIFVQTPNFKQSLITGLQKALLTPPNQNIQFKESGKFVLFTLYRLVKGVLQLASMPIYFARDLVDIWKISHDPLFAEKPRVRMKQNLAFIFDKVDSWFTTPPAISEEAKKSYNDVLALLEGVDESPEAMLKAEEEIRAKNLGGLFTDHTLTAIAKDILNKYQRASIGIEIKGTYWYGDSEIQQTLQRGHFIEKIEPLQKYLVDQKGASEHKGDIEAYYKEKSLMKPSLEDREKFMANESQKIAAHLREVGREAKEDPEFRKAAAMAYIEYLKKRNKDFGGGEVPTLDEAMGIIQGLANLSDHLVDKGKVQLTKPFWKWYDRLFSRGTILSSLLAIGPLAYSFGMSIISSLAGFAGTILFGITGISLFMDVGNIIGSVANSLKLDLPLMYYLITVGSTVGLAISRIFERDVVAWFSPYSTDVHILSKLFGVTPEQFDGLWDRADWPVSVGAPTLTGKLRGRLKLFRARGTLADAPDVSLLGALLVLGEPPWSAVLSGFNILPTDAHDLALFLAEDTLFALVNNFITEYDPGVPADSLQKLKALFAGREEREDDNSIIRAAQMTKGLGIEYSLKHLFTHPIFEGMSQKDKTDYRNFLKDWVSLDERDEISIGGGRGPGFLSFVLGGSSWNRHYGKRVGSLAPGAREAYKVFRITRELDKKWGNVVNTEKAFQELDGDKTGLVGVDYQLLATKARNEFIMKKAEAELHYFVTLPDVMRQVNALAGAIRRDPETRLVYRYLFSLLPDEIKLPILHHLAREIEVGGKFEYKEGKIEEGKLELDARLITAMEVVSGILGWEDMDVVLADLQRVIEKADSVNIIFKLLYLFEHGWIQINESQLSRLFNTALGNNRFAPEIQKYLSLLSKKLPSERRGNIDRSATDGGDRGIVSSIQNIESDQYTRDGGKHKIQDLIRKLKGSRFSKKRGRSAQILGHLGATEAIPTLIEALRDPDELVRETSKEALIKIGQASIPGLIKALKHKDWNVRAASAKALGHLGVAEAIPDLIMTLKDKSLSVHFASEEALRKIGSPAMAKLLSTLWGIDETTHKIYMRVDPIVYERVVMTIGRLNVPDVPALILLLSDKEVSIRLASLEALYHLRASDAIPALIEALKDKDISSPTAELLGELQASEAVSALIAEIRNTNPDVPFPRTAGSSAAKALGKLKSTEAVQTLIRALEYKDRSIRIASAVALGEIGASEAIPAFIKALKDDEDMVVRNASKEALIKIGSASTPRLIELLGEEDPFVYGASIEALIGIGFSAIPALINALKGENVRIRQGAIEALGELHATEAIPVLITLLKDRNTRVRRASAKALGILDATEAIPALLSVLKDEPEVVIETFSKFKSETISEVLQHSFPNIDRTTIHIFVTFLSSYHSKKIQLSQVPKEIPVGGEWVEDYIYQFPAPPETTWVGSAYKLNPRYEKVLNKVNTLEQKLVRLSEEISGTNDESMSEKSTKDGGEKTLLEKMREDIHEHRGFKDPDSRVVDYAPYVFVTLVGGRGTRFKPTTPKVIYPIGDTPLALLSIQAAKKLNMPVVAVVGDRAEEVKAVLGMEEVDRYVESLDPGAGTGYGAFQVERALPPGYQGNIVLIPGDVIVPETFLALLLKNHSPRVGIPPTLTLLTAETEEPDGKGRIVRRKDSSVELIIEQSTIDEMIRAGGGKVHRDERKVLISIGEPEEKDPVRLSQIKGATLTLSDGTLLTGTALNNIKEINLGIYVAKSRELFDALREVKNDKRPTEWFATDVVEIMVRKGLPIRAVLVRDPKDLRKLSGPNNTPEFIGVVREFLEELLPREFVGDIYSNLLQQVIKGPDAIHPSERVLVAINRVLVSARDYLNIPLRDATRTFPGAFTEAVVNAAEVSPNLEQFEGHLQEELKRVFTDPYSGWALDGGNKVVSQEMELTPKVISTEPTYEEIIAHRIWKNTGLFIEKRHLLDPRTRNIVGKISEKVIFPEAVKSIIQNPANGVTAEDIVKLYALLGRYFEGVELKKDITLPSDFDVSKLQNPLIDLNLIKDSSVPKDLFEDMMMLLFTQDQVNELKRLRDETGRQRLEVEEIEQKL